MLHVNKSQLYMPCRRHWAVFGGTVRQRTKLASLLPAEFIQYHEKRDSSVIIYAESDNDAYDALAEEYPDHVEIRNVDDLRDNTRPMDDIAHARLVIVDGINESSFALHTLFCSSAVEYGRTEVVVLFATYNGLMLTLAQHATFLDSKRETLCNSEKSFTPVDAEHVTHDWRLRGLRKYSDYLATTV